MEEESMQRNMMSGHEILQHFAARLAHIEAAMPSLSHVLQVPAIQDLDAYRKNYEGTPVVCPTSWAPCWKTTLRVSFLSEGLQSLLRDCVEVEVFRLQYKIGETTGQLSEGAIQKEKKEHAESICVDSKVKCQTHMPTKIFSEYKGMSNGEDSSTDRKELDVVHSRFPNNSTKFHSTSSEKTLLRLYGHPIPSSSTELLDFAAFVSQASSLLLLPTNQLMYLTWRSLPQEDDFNYSSATSEFRFFVEKLVHPTTTPGFIPNDIIKQRNLWMGALVTSRLHFDALDNLHMCLSGRKVFHLYSPLDLPNLYPERRREGALNNFSSIGSIFLVNLEQHPRFSYAKCFRAEVKEGEAIFIPAGWWHEVFTLQETISVNVWFGPSPNASFRPTLLHLNSEKYFNFMLERQNLDTL